MADSKALATLRRLTIGQAKELGLHEHTVKHASLQVASGVLGVAGGASAAAIDYFLGTPDPSGSGIPECFIGPVPVTASAGVVGKLAAFALVVASKGNAESTYTLAAHVTNYMSDGLLAGSASLTLMRLLLSMRAPQVFAQTPVAPTP